MNELMNVSSVGVSFPCHFQHHALIQQSTAKIVRRLIHIFQFPRLKFPTLTAVY